jgi:hypothetical protein
VRPQQNRCAHFKYPTWSNARLGFVSYSKRQELFRQQLIDKMRSPYKHGCHGTLTYHAGLFFRRGYAIKIKEWELASWITYAFLRVCNYPVTALLQA